MMNWEKDDSQPHISESPAENTLEDSEVEVESEYESSLFSIGATSSITTVHPQATGATRFRYENNRRYHTYHPESWHWPNDEQEQDRLQIQDQMCALLLDGELYTSPLTDPRRILDIGTGTGVWASEMARKFPNARVIGTDLSPIQVPPPDNCTWEIEDANSEWIYPPNYFSFIHTRQLICGITDWRQLVQQAHLHLHADGWVEFTESPKFFESENPGSVSHLRLKHAERLFHSAMNRMGRNAASEVWNIKNYMTESGFVDISETKLRIPLGPWGANATEKQVGRYNMLSFWEGVEGFLLSPLTNVLGMDVGEVRALIEECRAEIINKRHRLYVWLVIVKGRKPTLAELSQRQSS